MKRLLYTYMLIMAVGLISPLSCFADGVAPGEFSGPTWWDYQEDITEGTGSMSDPYLIKTPGQLARLSFLVNSGTNDYKGKVIALGADIDLNKVVDGKRVQWIPIGFDSENQSRVFKGLFVGMDLKDYATNDFKAEQKHRIRGVYINVNSLANADNFGLFGILAGNVSHLQLEDININVDLSSQTLSTINVFVGGLCGSTSTSNISEIDEFRSVYYEKTSSGELKDRHYVYNAIDDVSVGGEIAAKANANTMLVGGICGRFDNLGIYHSTTNIRITTSNCCFVGGICGIDNGHYYKEQNTFGKCLYDCVANATITCDDDIEQTVMVGGIVGQLLEGEQVRACVSSGSINCSYTSNSPIHSVGGICGNMQPGSRIFASGSTMFIKSHGKAGGIVGHMPSSTEAVLSERTKVECCSFCGHLDGSRKHLNDKGETIWTDGTQSFNDFTGGICGKMDWTDSREHITRCLLLGTINNEDYTYHQPSATVGWAGETGEGKDGKDGITSTVTYCYYDTRLFNGNAIPGSSDGGTCAKGLPTEDLTSANITKLSTLDPQTEETGEYGFRLVKGYYPIFYENNGSGATYYREYSHYSLYDERMGRLFNFYDAYPGLVNMASTVYIPGAMLCATPVSFVKGDCAGDFVSTMSAPTKSYQWEESGTGRRPTLTCEIFFPESQVITVKDKTATANNQGTCHVTMQGIVRTKAVAINRPSVVGGIKYIGLNSTLSQYWDGYEATGFAGGTGTAADPFIVKNASQLYHAIRTNQEGQFYKQICNITIFKEANEDFKTLLTPLCVSGVRPQNPYPESAVGAGWQNHDCDWNANYNGDGHTVSGLYLWDYVSRSGAPAYNVYYSLFGNELGPNGSISNLAVVDTWIDSENYSGTNTFYGIIAGKVYGTITNCITQGISNVDRPCGGICAFVRNNGTVEDCISAVVSLQGKNDEFTPFVSYRNTANQGHVKNCLFVTPTMFSSSSKSTGNLPIVQNCYWLKGYEPGNTGYTLDEIGTALGSRDRWTYTKNYFPMLKTFAETDLGKLMMVPVRTDKNYEFNTSTNKANNYLLGFTKMLEFEPGAASWTNWFGTNYIEADSELGIIAPKATMPDTGYQLYECIYAELGKSLYYIPLRTNANEIEPGITFVDPKAEAACVAAFDNNPQDGRLSLAELSAVTTEQTLTAFHTSEGQQIVKFPEFRFFKAVSTLTSQLSGLNKLEEARLPYNLLTIGGDTNLDGSGSKPFAGTKIEEITLPGKVASVEPGAFAGSDVKTISVDPFNSKFVSRNGILFDKNNTLISYPNGRIDEGSDEIIIPGVIEEIKPGAVYKVSGLSKVFFDTDDYATVANLNGNGFVSANGNLLDVYICDATYGSVLFNEYLDDESWEDYADADKLHCYYPLKIGSAKAATMYIGFDTQLPIGLKAYTIVSDSKEESLAYLKKMSNKIPNRSPIVIFADEPGTYRLFPLDEQLEPWNMYENKLNGVGRDGMEVYQSDADRGSILTLGRNSSGALGFFYYKGTTSIPPYRAYLTYEWVTNAKQYLLFKFLDDETTGIESPTPTPARGGEGSLYDLQGRKIAEEPISLKKGIYIYKGKKIIVK